MATKFSTYRFGTVLIFSLQMAFLSMKNFTTTIITLLLTVGWFGCQTSTNQEQGLSGTQTTDKPSAKNKSAHVPANASPKVNPYVQASFATKVIPGKENTFGYEITIRLGGKTQRIRQEHKPGVPGIRGFETQTDAQKVADFVVNKIKTKGFPPTVTPEELAKLGVLK